MVILFMPELCEYLEDANAWLVMYIQHRLKRRLADGFRSSDNIIAAEKQQVLRS